MNKSSKGDEYRVGDESSNDASLLSVAEARRIMGPLAKDMLDSEIEEAIYNLTAIARSYVRLVPDY